VQKVDLGDGLEIFDDYCLYIKSTDSIIIADLHLGYEGVMQSEGVFFPRYQKNIILNRLERILDRLSPKEVIVNGDFKHEFSRNLSQEWREVKEVLDFLMKRTEVSMVRGNHDNYLKTILSKDDIELRDAYEKEDIILSHGHHEIIRKENQILIMAHEHPSIRLRDEIGAGVRLPCFLYDEEAKILVLPAFSPLASGTDVVSTPTDELISPILKNHGCENFKVYAISDSELIDFKRVEELKRAWRV
jgi:putative SbcD/Mre11-related phosphoesterase